MPKHTRRLLRGTGILCALVLGATACGGSDDDSSSGKQVSSAGLRAALKKGGTVTVWAWEPTLKQVAADFEKKYPKVDIKLVNAGTNNDQYKALQNAISAKKGVPDVAQLEYYALSQYALTKSVTDLKPYGADKLAGSYSPGPVELGEVRGRHLRPADGLGPDGALLQQEGLRQVQDRCADDVGRVRRGRPQAPQGRPEGVHHQRPG
jgi:ABC-type glycerol-3-phosphate transport system substrate-binding protein